MRRRADTRAFRDAMAAIPNRMAGGLLIVVACLLVYGPSLRNGLPHGDSFYLNVNWSHAFIDALSWQTPYPRWLPSMWEGTGAADFYFYAPLPFYLVAGIDALCGACSIESSITLSALLLRVVAAFGTYQLARTLGTRGPAVLAALFVALSPYHILDWNERQAYSELAGAALLPFCLMSLHATLRGRTWIGLPIFTALIGLTHLPSLVIFFVLSAVLSLTAWRPERIALLARALGVGALGMLISAFYWLPAVSLMDTVNPENLGTQAWQDQLLDFGSEDFSGIYPALWLPFVALAALSIAALLVVRSGAADLWRGAGVVLLLTIFLVTPLSAPFWRHLPIDAIQFPWRFFIASDIAFALVIPGLAAVAQGPPDVGAMRARAASLVMLGFLAVVLFPLIDWWKIRHQPLQLTAPLEHRMGTLEWLGRENGIRFFSHLMILDEGHLERIKIDPRPVRTDGSGNSVQPMLDAPNEIVFRASCQTDCTVVLRRGWWSLWRLEALETPDPIPIYPTPGFSLIAADLPPGERTYRLVLEWPLVARQSLWLSILACWAVFALWSVTRKSRPPV